MGNTASHKSTEASTIKSRDSFGTEALTVGDNSSSIPSETKYQQERSRPMKLMGKQKTNTGGTKSKMPQAKKKAASPQSPKSAALAKKEKDIEDQRDDSVPRPTFIRDDQVQVNLAMADLMAYLQVVANNSSNLPLTRRDDPELTRMVSNLSSEEYARKSAAFLPADVRVIGGSFLKYGNVWDLPTSEEYTALDGAQEPGKLVFQRTVQSSCIQDCTF